MQNHDEPAGQSYSRDAQNGNSWNTPDTMMDMNTNNLLQDLVYLDGEPQEQPHLQNTTVDPMEVMFDGFPPATDYIFADPLYPGDPTPGDWSDFILPDPAIPSYGIDETMNSFQQPMQYLQQPPIPSIDTATSSFSTPTPYPQQIPDFRPPPTQHPQHPPAHRVPLRSDSWAEVASLPWQRQSPTQPAPLQQSPRAMKALSPRIEQLAARQPTRNPTPPPPSFVFDMREATPPPLMSADEFTRVHAQMQDTISPTIRTAGWLKHRTTVGERSKPRPRNLATQLSPRTASSPARSSAGRSERSTGPRKIRERELSGDFKCDQHECKQGFHDIDGLRSHILSVHNKYRPWACAICFKEFSYPKDVVRHQKTHEQRRTLYYCKEEGCEYSEKGSKGFKVQWSVKRHTIEKHNGTDSGVQMSVTTSIRG